LTLAHFSYFKQYSQRKSTHFEVWNFDGEGKNQASGCFKDLIFTSKAKTVKGDSKNTISDPGTARSPSPVSLFLFGRRCSSSPILNKIVGTILSNATVSLRLQKVCPAVLWRANMSIPAAPICRDFRYAPTSSVR
jgi:hypothetical protein